MPQTTTLLDLLRQAPGCQQLAMSQVWGERLETVRVALCRASRRGLIERADDGGYHLTDRGISKLNYIYERDAADAEADHARPLRLERVPAQATYTCWCNVWTGELDGQKCYTCGGPMELVQPRTLDATPAQTSAPPAQTSPDVGRWQRMGAMAAARTSADPLVQMRGYKAFFESRARRRR